MALSSRVRSAAGLAAAVAVVSGILAGVTFTALRDAGRADAERQLQRQSRHVAEGVRGEVSRYLTALTVAAAAAGTHDTLTNAKFQQLSEPAAALRLSGATSMSYLLPVADAQIAETQALWRSRGVDDLQFHPAGTGQHVFSVMVRSLDGVTVPRTGIDASESPPLMTMLRTARSTGRVAVSQPYRLLVDRALPPAQRRLAFTLAVPVYGLPWAGEREFRGWMAMSLRAPDFLGDVLPRISDGVLNVALYAAAGDQAPLVAVHAPAGAGDLSRAESVMVGDQVWQLRIEARSRSMVGSVALPVVVAVAVLALGCMLAALAYVLATGHARARRKVAEATAGLAAAETSAREQATLLSTILDAMGDGVGVVDEHGDFLLHNSAAKAMLGVSEDRNGADRWQEHYGIFLPDGSGPYPTADLPLVRALAGERMDMVDLLIRNAHNPDGLTISVTARPLRLRGGRPAAVAVFHDVTASRAATAAIKAGRDELAAQKDYLTQVLDALQNTVITCDTAGVLVHTNAAGGARVGDGDLVGRHIAEISAGLVATDLHGHTIAACDMPVPRVLRGEGPVRQEAFIQYANGSSRAVMLHARPLRDSSGAVIGVVGSSYDITALREREADLAAFAGVAAHDLKAPLSIVAGYADLLDTALAEGDSLESLRPTLPKIQAGIRRMQQLIDDLLAYATARDARITVQEVDLQGVVADIITERTAHLRAANDRGAPVLFPDIYVGPLPVVSADAGMMRQLFDNLIGNALKYTLPGQPARLDIAAHLDDPATVTVTIADRGIGIPGEEQPYVFDQFHRVAAHTKAYAGTGLGLAICKRVVERHRGTIQATDNPGGGTRIVITLPAAPSPSPHPPPEDGTGPRGAPQPGRLTGRR
ncbi:ATP-binding protein [Actinoplanes sp. NPDC051861]|uniref:ATP-binding protein n=1 Tax=Actinoplanes sp. NPDC051861 TaxID=3155170 RepID=UPI00343487B3